MTNNMLKLKNKELRLLILLISGFSYFSAISNLEVNDFWKSQIALIPLQLMALAYVTYLRLNRQAKDIVRE